MALYIGICNDRSRRRPLHWSQIPFSFSNVVRKREIIQRSDGSGSGDFVLYLMYRYRLVRADN
jgi:hypothetical protein